MHGSILGLTSDSDVINERVWACDVPVTGGHLLEHNDFHVLNRISDRVTKKMNILTLLKRYF